MRQGFNGGPVQGSWRWGPGTELVRKMALARWVPTAAQSTALLSSAVLICEDTEGRRVASPQLVQCIGPSSALLCGVREAAQSSL